MCYLKKEKKLKNKLKIYDFLKCKKCNSFYLYDFWKVIFVYIL